MEIQFHITRVSHHLVFLVYSNAVVPSMFLKLLASD